MGCCYVPKPVVTPDSYCIRKFSPDGQLEWSRDLGVNLLEMEVHLNRVFVRSGTRHWCLDSETGEIVWHVNLNNVSTGLGGGLAAYMLVTPVKDLIVMGGLTSSENGHLICIDQQGEIKWNRSPYTPAGESFPLRYLPLLITPGGNVLLNKGLDNIPAGADANVVLTIVDSETGESLSTFAPFTWNYHGFNNIPNEEMARFLLGGAGSNVVPPVSGARGVFQGFSMAQGTIVADESYLYVSSYGCFTFEENGEWVNPLTPETITFDDQETSSEVVTYANANSPLANLRQYSGCDLINSVLPSQNRRLSVMTIYNPKAGDNFYASGPWTIENPVLRTRYRRSKITLTGTYSSHYNGLSSHAFAGMELDSEAETIAAIGQGNERWAARILSGAPQAFIQSSTDMIVPVAWSAPDEGSWGRAGVLFQSRFAIPEEDFLYSGIVALDETDLSDRFDYMGSCGGTWHAWREKPFSQPIPPVSIEIEHTLYFREWPIHGIETVEGRTLLNRNIVKRNFFRDGWHYVSNFVSAEASCKWMLGDSEFTEIKGVRIDPNWGTVIKPQSLLTDSYGVQQISGDRVCLVDWDNETSTVVTAGALFGTNAGFGGDGRYIPVCPTSDKSTQKFAVITRPGGHDTLSVFNGNGNQIYAIPWGWPNYTNTRLIEGYFEDDGSLIVAGDRTSDFPTIF